MQMNTCAIKGKFIFDENINLFRFVQISDCIAI